jgi:CHASE3 domain sensor protein
MGSNNYKIIVAILVVVIVAGGTVGYSTINKDKTSVRAIVDVELPMEQAVREVEVSVWETANSIFYYMVEPSAISLEEYKKQLKDVENFMAKYNALVDTEQEKQMAAKFQNMWTDSVTKAEELIQLRDKLKELHEKACEAVHEADDVIDYKVQVAFVEGLPDLIEKEKAVREVEVSIWEAINATNYYIHRQFGKPQREYSHQLEEVTGFWGKYKSLNITPAEEAQIKEFETEWNLSVKLMNECYSLADELKQKYLAFWESVHAADDVIDFEIQECLKKRIESRMTRLTR